MMIMIGDNLAVGRGRSQLAVLFGNVATHLPGTCDTGFLWDIGTLRLLVELSNLSANLLGHGSTRWGRLVGALVSTTIAVLNVFCVAHLVICWPVHCYTFLRVSVRAFFLVFRSAFLV